MTPISDSNSTQSGFTLLELLLVLAILAMASVLVIPNLTGLEARTFSAQVRDAHSILNYARRIAVVTGQPRRATFYISNDEGEELSAREAATVNSSDTRWQSYGTSLVFRDSTDREVDVEDKIEIDFFPEGGSTGGTLLLSRDEQLAIITVDPFSGRISTEIPEQ